ncbi:hypothetical protein [Acinetobacter sp. 1125_18A]|uniref:hypothetical protein n=1 Tax=Acinetobacter sp. 1125_18A TaxID=2605959 RepID=UPI004057D563
MGRQGCHRWAGVQDVPLAQHEQKQSTALFAAQGLASPTKSNLNFECKVWHCKFFRIKQFILHTIDLIKNID